MKTYNRSDFKTILCFYAKAEKDGYKIIVSENSTKPECYGLDDISELRNLGFIKRMSSAGFEISISDDHCFILARLKREKGNTYIKNTIGYIKVKDLVISTGEKTKLAGEEYPTIVIDEIVDSSDLEDLERHLPTTLS